ncbi:hypothetical protein HDU92_003825 [Lobulomyces angularis]|nr:hypothetical protein HDU92_003825 [Lobulomyces angularis]
MEEEKIQMEKELKQKEDKLYEENLRKMKSLPWTAKETATLIKAVKLFPGGVQERWDKIAEYINLHGGEDDETEAYKKMRERTSNECIQHQKAIQQGGVIQDRSKLQQDFKKKDDKVNPSMPKKLEEEKKTTIWTPQEQIILENSLRKYPANLFKSDPSERWKKIAAEFGDSKNLKEVKLRVKELQDLIKKKKELSGK